MVILQNMSFFGSYSNEMFPPPLSHEDEIKYITLMKNGDKECVLAKHFSWSFDDQEWDIVKWRLAD